jgi:hypothetical protein
MQVDFLQNFTNLGQLMTDLLEKVRPQAVVKIDSEKPQNTIPDDSTDSIQDILLMKLAAEYSDEMVLSDENSTIDTNEDRTIQFQRNQHTIKRSLESYIAAHGKLPNITTLAKITGLSRPTIHSHLNEGVLGLQFKQELSKLQLLSTELLVKLYQMGQNGDSKAIKMLFDIIQSGQRVQVPQRANFIQINNLKVQNQNIERLSPKAKSRIEKIIRSELKLKSSLG